MPNGWSITGFKRMMNFQITNEPDAFKFWCVGVLDKGTPSHI